MTVKNGGTPFLAEIISPSMNLFKTQNLNWRVHHPWLDSVTYMLRLTYVPESLAAAGNEVDS